MRFVVPDQARLPPVLQRDQQSRCSGSCSTTCGTRPARRTSPHETWTAWTDGYVAVNQLFADEISQPASDSTIEPIIMLQDYHLYLAAGMIRELRPQRDHPALRPHPLARSRLLAAAADRDPPARSARACSATTSSASRPATTPAALCTPARRMCPGVQIDYTGRGVIWNGRRIEVRALPDLDRCRRRAPQTPTARKRASTTATCRTT